MSIGDTIGYMIQSLDTTGDSPVIIETYAYAGVVKIETVSNGNSPKITWVDSDGEIHNNRPDFHVVILGD